MVLSPPLGLRSLAGCLALLVVLLLGSAQFARSEAETDWSGTWESRWRDGGASLHLQQDGARVTGTYPLHDGRIEAWVTGRELRGRWVQPDRSGSFIFVQSADGRTFSGRFESGEWWTGARGGAEVAPTYAVDQSSPMTVLGSFLKAANAARDGNLDALGRVVGLVRPPGAPGAGDDRFAHARALYDVIDQTTFRLWDMPHQGTDAGDTASTELSQAGTGQTVTISFRREGGQWYFDPPPVERLKTLADRLRAARASLPEQAGQNATGSPRDTMRDFLTSFRFQTDGSGPAAIAALDLRGRPEITRTHDGQVLAGYLKRVIDRAGYVIWQEIPDDPTSRVPYVHFAHPEGSVIIAPVETETGVVWQFSPDTLNAIRRVYTAMEDMPVAPGLAALPDTDIHFAIRKVLRGIAPGTLAQFGPFERWQWIALAATLIVMLGAAMLASRAASVLTWPASKPETEDHPVGRATVSWAVRGLVAGLVLLVANWVLGLPESVSLVLTTIATILVVISLFLLGWLAVGAVTDRYRRTERITQHNLILVSLASGVLRGTLLVLSVLVLAHALSLPITGVIAGFGIGGIAVALAVQPTLQNLLSGFTIYADRPISVGDFCRFGDKMGTVEHIGLRSTRLRTLDRTVISVPNSQFLDMELENFAHRDRFLFQTTLQLRYETTPDQMRYVLATLRALLIAHPKVLAEPLRVRFAGLGAHSLDIDVFSYILAADIDTFTSIREDLLLRVMTTVEDAGAQFAFPSIVHYHADDRGMAQEDVERAEKTVADWRSRGELPFPDHDWKSKAELSGSLDYPPEGSVCNQPGWSGDTRT